MKKIFVFVFALVFIFSLNIANILAKNKEEIVSWQEIIDIHQDASLSVQEKIVYDFDSKQKHGIYRDIPVKYKRHNLNYNLRLNNIKVTDENGRALKFCISRQGRYKRIEIGCADKLISGRHTYIISYQVKRAINYFSDFDELYWNITGNEWPVEIKQVRAVINLPAEISAEKLRAVCYVGSYGSSANCLSSRYIYDHNGKVKSLSFTHGRLGPNQGLTIAADWPKGLVTQPGKWQNLLETIKDNWIFGLPFITFFILFYLWWTRGRDPRGRKTIIARYSPPEGMTPAMVGVIIDEKLETKDISAEIIYLAVRGYLRITRLEKEGILFKSTDWLLEKLKEPDETLASYEQKLMQGLFKKSHIKATLKDLVKIVKKSSDRKEGLNNLIFDSLRELVEEQVKVQNQKAVVKLSYLKNSLVNTLKEIQIKVYKQAVEQGYFHRNPNKVRRFYLIFGAVVSMFGQFFIDSWGWSAVISFMVSGLLFIVFSFFMPARTKKGVEAREHILGLKEYLSVAEKDRLKFHNAPAKNPKHFEELLPYAMVLGVEKEWAKQFKDIYRGQPDWYQDPSGRAFSSAVLVNSLDSFQAKANSAFTSSAARGGSGFSGGGAGGGFGGGGGGSW